MNFRQKFLSLFLSLFMLVSFTQAQQVLITFQVDMNQYIADGNSFTTPYVTGSWTQDPVTFEWCGDCHPMLDPDGDNVWEVGVMIDENSTQEYKFEVDNFSDEEPITPGSSCTVTTDGFTNRSLTTTTADEVLSVVCWGCCDPCGSTCSSASNGDCTDPNASNYNPAATEDDGSCLYLCSEDPGNLLNVTANGAFDDGSGNSYGSNIGMGLVAGGNNVFGGFIWNVNTSGVNASDMCISIDFEVTGDPASFPKVLEFRIENNGCGGFPCPWNDFNMSVPGPGTYNFGGIVSAGNVAAGGFDPEGMNPSVVAAIAHFESTPLAGNIDVIFSNLCVSTNCGSDLGCTDPAANNFNPDAVTDDGTCVYDFTFNVDMNCYDGSDVNIDHDGNGNPSNGSFTEVAIEGPSFGWCGSCVPLADGDGDGIWSVTLELPLGDLEYKYAHDAWSGQEQLLDDMINGASCAPVTDFANFANRLVTITPNGSVDDVYGSCELCNDPTACIASNFTSAPTGLFEDQTVSGGTKTQLKFDHYSDAADGCILKGGTIGSLDPSAAYTQFPGQVLLQGGQINGNAAGHDFSAQLAPNSTFTLFNANTFPSGSTGSMVPGAFYKWQVRCGCVLDPTLPLPDRLGVGNVILSPWSAFDVFTNLGAPMQPGDDHNSTQKSLGLEKGMKLFPNPNNGQFVVDFINFDEGQINLIVRNLLGEVVSNSTYLNNAKNQQFQMDISDLAKGQYILEVNQGQHFESQLIILK